MSPRLTLAAEAGLLAADRVALFNAPGDLDITCFDGATLTVSQPMMPDAARWQSRGVQVAEPATDSVELAVVFLPRARAEARALVAAAMAASTGKVVIDGQKTDGIEAMLKDLRRRVEVSGVISKAHGKLFAVETGTEFDEWSAQGTVIDGRWHTVPGVFSADSIDPGSALLADALPETLSGRVADLGAGWGYLSASALARSPQIAELHLVEAHAGALACARQNLTDDRAQFHWADVLAWQAPAPLDAVVMNPPFHSGRATNTGLGRGFIATAARSLRRGGSLWMVANRHLPYEETLRAHFVETNEIGGDGRYKLFHSRAGR